MRGDKAIGRIVAIDDDVYNNYANEKCGAWGFFECFNDKEAAHALFDAVATWHKQRGLSFMRGPLNPSTNYTCGMLVGGFNEKPTIMMPWNFSYYPELVESYYMYKEQDLFSYDLHKDNINIPLWIREQLQQIKKRNDFTYRQSCKATLEQDIRTMLEIFQEAWANNFAFSPGTLDEASNHIKSLKTILDPKLFVMFYYGDKPAGGMLALPNVNPLLKEMNGNLDPRAIWYWYKLRKEIKSKYRMVLFGIKEEYRMLGLPLLLFNFIIEISRDLPHFNTIEGSWTLEDNKKINDTLEDFGGIITKRYRIYRKELASLCL